MKYFNASAKNSLFILGLICALMCISLMADTHELYLPSKYEKAKKTMSALYPKAKKVSWRVDDHGNHESHFKLNGEKYRADFHPEGQWIETEQSIKWSELPEAIQDKIKENFDRDDISEIEKVDHFKKGKFYDVEFKQKGKNLDIEYRSNGQRIN